MPAQPFEHWKSMRLAPRERRWLYARGRAPAGSERRRFYADVFWNGRYWENAEGHIFADGNRPGQLQEWRPSNRREPVPEPLPG